VAIDQRLWNLIRQGAKQRGLDPRAVGAVALSEGGLKNRPGDIGDLAGGGSYGPFQLYAQGALPSRFRGNPARADAWAWSPAGINYALDAIAKVAAGKTGRQAITHIVKRFEKPAAPGAEIERALGHYQTLGGAMADLAASAGGKQKQPGRVPSLLAQQQVRPPPKFAFNEAKMSRDISNLFLQGGGGIDFTQLPGLVQGAAQWVQSPLKKVPTPVVQQRGIVDPDGDLQDPIEAVDPKRGNAVTRMAARQIGKPYVWGGESRAEGGFDCSGLIQWAYKQMGINLGRTTYDQISEGRAVNPGKPGQFRPGDLIFPHKGHVVMYVGGGKVIAAPHTGTVVQYQPLAKFGRPLAVRRVLG
jgi:hypothetical protein